MSALVLLLFSCGGGFHVGPAAQPDPLVQLVNRQPMAKEGLRLFNLNWTSVKGQELSDGLGPMFNAQSCAHCHPRGGAAGNDQNVQLISFVPSSKADSSDWERLFQKEGALLDTPQTRSVVLPRRGLDAEYEKWRLNFLGLVSDEDSLKRKERMERVKQRAFQRRAPVHSLRKSHRHDVVLSERNTPALFGVGLIDTIELETLTEIAKRQAAIPDGIAGRVATLPGGAVGRFGWRGQTATLKGFVENACANELGLQSSQTLQPKDPLNGRTLPGPATDVSDLQIIQMVDFLKALPAPTLSPNAKMKNVAAVGRSVMKMIHCDRCHVPDLGEVEGVFSDLLLHDMGSGLADPVAAPPKVKTTTHNFQPVRNAGGYSGFALPMQSMQLTEVIPTNTRQEWRTPPLWGVADTAPYLHDGRAKTLHDAILLHGGEASQSRAQYSRLSRHDRHALLTFLGSLRAPQSLLDSLSQSP